MNDKEVKGENFSDMLRRVLRTHTQSLFTASPGIIQSYNRSTKRASIQLTPRTAFEDGTFGQPPILPNVPVLMPSGGGFMVDVPLVAGDAVLIVFCRRGIGQFKKTFSECNPSGGIMQADAAVAIAGFGALSVTPGTGISLQAEDGSVKVDVKINEVEIKVGGSGGATLNDDGSVDFVNGAQITSTGDFVTASGISLDTHVHLAGTPPGDTGVPK